MDIDKTLHKWYEAKKELDALEKKIAKYKLEIGKEMNRKETDKLSAGGYTVSRRRNTRSYITRDSVPANLWKEYATRCNYDAYYLVRR